MKENAFKVGNKNKNPTEDSIEQRKVCYLNKFMNSIIQKKILRTSPILYEFLALDDKTYKKYVNKLSQIKYDLEIKLTNLITMNGKVKCSLEKKSIGLANVIINKYSSLSQIYNKINLCSDYIMNDFQNLSLHMNEMSSYFNVLIENIKIYNNEDLKNNFTELKNIFNNWSISLGKQSDLFFDEIKENFNYMTLETDEMNSIYLFLRKI